jgi:hypothetical protein
LDRRLAGRRILIYIKKVSIASNLRAEAERCRKVASRYSVDCAEPMKVLAAQLEAQAKVLEERHPEPR